MVERNSSSRERSAETAGSETGVPVGGVVVATTRALPDRLHQLSHLRAKLRLHEVIMIPAILKPVLDVEVRDVEVVLCLQPLRALLLGAEPHSGTPSVRVIQRV